MLIEATASCVRNTQAPLAGSSLQISGCVNRGPVCVYSLMNRSGLHTHSALPLGSALRREGPLPAFPSRPGGCSSFLPGAAPFAGDPEACALSVQPPAPPAPQAGRTGVLAFVGP